MKDANDTKNWTKRDLKRMRRKKTIKGYDVSYNNNYVMFDTNDIQYMYLVEEDEIEAVEEEEAEEGGSDDEEHPSRWAGSSPQPRWAESDGNGMMFR